VFLKIGHELTGGHGIDHARTLSIVLPAVMKVCLDANREKLLQYAERIWNVTEGDEDARINRAIELTEQFFERMKVPTRLSQVDLGEADIDDLIEKLTHHGMVSLGEHDAITPDVSREILIAAL
jgi:NADP-dependent alcohol dehydrogenase